MRENDAVETALQICGPVAGGVRSHLRVLVPTLREFDWRAPLAGPPGVLDPARTEYPVHLAWGRGAHRLAPGVARIRSAVERERPRVLHAHGLKAGVAALMARTGVPVIVTAHNVVIAETAGRAEALLGGVERELFTRADLVIAPSAQVADTIGETAPDANVVIQLPAFPAPVVERTTSEVRAALGVPVDQPWVVVPARLHPQKNLIAVLDVAERLTHRRPGVRFSIFGEGPQRVELEAAIAKRGLSATVELAGVVANGPEVMAAADAVALTSAWEGVPLSIPESVWVGTPVVATPVGVAEEMLTGGRGRVVPHGDIDGFVDALDAVLDHSVGASPSQSATDPPAGLAPGPLIEELISLYRGVSE